MVCFDLNQEQTKASERPLEPRVHIHPLATIGVYIHISTFRGQADVHLATTGEAGVPLRGAGHQSYQFPPRVDTQGLCLAPSWTRIGGAVLVAARAAALVAALVASLVAGLVAAPKSQKAHNSH